MPEFPILRDLFYGLTREDLLDRALGAPEFELFIGAAQGRVGFIQASNDMVFEALQILTKNWKLAFDGLGSREKRRWGAVYLSLWAWVGKNGSVPTAAAQPVEDSEGIFEGVGRTAFDLLIHQPGGTTSNFNFEKRPLPGLFLEAFACLSSPSPVQEFREEVESGKKFPWVSMGILSSHLQRHNMHPMLVAVDLTRSTDSILRDLRHIIKEKRVGLHLVETDRRIKQESFGKIEDLDGHVCLSTPPLKRCVTDFEASARLDLSPLIGILRREQAEIHGGEPTAAEILAILEEAKISGN